MKRLKNPLVVFMSLYFLLPVFAMADEPKTSPITLAQALQSAMMNNPNLNAYSYEVLAREAQTLQAGMLPNPDLQVQVENAGGSLNAFDQSETTLQLSQLVELGSKRDLRRTSANFSKELAGWDYEIQRVEVFAQVSRSFTQVLKAQEMVSLIGERVQLAQRLLKVVSERIKAGKVPAIEKIKTQVALANIKIKQKRAKMELVNARRKLSILWGESEPKFNLAQGDFYSIQALPKNANLSSNPRLSKWSTAMEHRQSQLDVELSKTTPDLTLSGGYRRLEQTNDNALIFGLSVPLQLFNRNQGAIAKARHRVLKVQEERKARELKMKEALMQAHSKVVFSHAKVVSIKTEVLPFAQEALSATSEGYRFGKFGLLEVLDSQKIFFQVQTQYLDALTEYHSSLVEVDRLTGAGPVTPKKHQESKEGEKQP